MKKFTLLFTLSLFVTVFVNFAVAQSSIVMNEIYSRGTTTDPDWIELYNKSNAAIDISGYKIYDVGGQGGTKAKKPIPSGTTIPAYGFYVVVTDDGAADAFGLSSSGEKVWLEDAAGTIIDTVTFAGHTATQSYARVPDGGTWQISNTLTRGASNGMSGAGTTILMNEIYARGTTAAPDWIELYNTTSAAIDISGFKIYDAGGQGGTKAKKQIPAGTSIPSKGYYVIVTDDGAADGFGLSSSGEKVWFEDASGAIIDTITFLAHSETQSFARIPDGGNWQVANTITRGLANYSAGVLTVAINELYARGTTDAPDWVEFYNTTNSAIDISGYKIYDAGGQSGSKAKKAIPAGTTILAKGYYVIVVDDGAADGFGLSSSGETVWFEDASGKIIDSVAFLAHTETQSYARIPDGGAWQVSNTITKGLTNGGGTGVNDKAIEPNSFIVFQNYPNPFNPSTLISYHLPKAGDVSVKVFDVMGRMVTELVNQNQTAGLHTVNFNAANLSSGVYYYTVKSGSYTDTKKLLLMK